jgi:hypothetical protein
MKRTQAMVLACGPPGWYRSASQNRDESGVNTSSTKIISPSPVRPNSNFVSAMMIPRPRAC